jgi:hypothetical protein
MAYIRTKNQKKARIIRFLKKLAFWKKKPQIQKAKLYVGGFPMKKYEVTFNYGRKMTVFARSFTESKDIAEGLMRTKNPTMNIRAVQTKEII